MRKTRTVSLVIALLCVAQSASSADGSARTPGGTSLLKPAPTDQSPFLPKAEVAARKRFPELFQGRFTGTMGVYIDLNIDGEVLSLDTIQFPAGPITDRSLSKERSDAILEVSVHDAYARPGALGSKFVGWFGPKRNYGLYLYYRVLKWPIDPLRSVVRVRTAVANRYPLFFSPRRLEATADDANASVVTVVMNYDGTIDAAELIEHANQDEFSARRTFDRFLQLGLKPEQLAYRGHTTNRGDWQEKNLTAPLLLIEYAWRRINDDPPDEVLQSNDVFDRLSLLHLQEQKDHPPDEAFLRRYFPGVWQNGLPNDVAGVWLLLARSGQVLDTGTTQESDTGAVEEQLQKRHRGIKTLEWTNVGAKTQSGRMAPLYYLWVAPDSPVTPKPSAEVIN